MRHLGTLLFLTTFAVTDAVAQSTPPQLSRLVPPSPNPDGFVADVPNVIPVPAKAEITARIRALQDSGFGDIGVAILPSIGDFQPYEVGLQIYRSWKVGRVDALGSARRDLGFIILIVPKELAPDGKGQCWITTGLGAEGIVTDATSGAICRDSIIPHLRERNYGDAVLAGVGAISARLHGDAGLTTQPGGAALLTSQPAGDADGDDGPSKLGYALGGVFTTIAGLFGAVAWRRRRPRRCGKCRQSMRRLDEQSDDAALDTGQRLEENLGSVDYDVWKCGGCGDETVIPYVARFKSISECAKCHVRAVKKKRRTLQSPTYTSTGLAEETSKCESCRDTRVETIVLAKRTPPSASSGSSSGGSSGGGSSFGGSGSSSGGGGGSSY